MSFRGEDGQQVQHFLSNLGDPSYPPNIFWKKKKERKRKEKKEEKEKEKNKIK